MTKDSERSIKLDGVVIDRCVGSATGDGLLEVIAWRAKRGGGTEMVTLRFTDLTVHDFVCMVRKGKAAIEQIIAEAKEALDWANASEEDD